LDWFRSIIDFGKTPEAKIGLKQTGKIDYFKVLAFSLDIFDNNAEGLLENVTVQSGNCSAMCGE